MSDLDDEIDYEKLDITDIIHMLDDLDAKVDEVYDELDFKINDINSKIDKIYKDLTLKISKIAR